MSQLTFCTAETVSDVLEVRPRRAVAVSSGSLATTVENLVLERPACERVLHYRSQPSSPQATTVDEYVALFVPASFTIETWSVSDAISLGSGLGLQGAIDRLLELFEVESLESGQEHPAEAFLTELARTSPSVAADAVAAVASQSHVAGPQIIRCIGRLSSPSARKTFSSLLKGALNSGDVQVRDAAIRSLEAWGGPDATQALEAHQESVGWLRSYVQRVLRDLKRQQPK